MASSKLTIHSMSAAEAAKYASARAVLELGSALYVQGVDQDAPEIYIGIGLPLGDTPGFNRADISRIKALEDALADLGLTIADIDGLQDALDGKAAVVHGHAIEDITGLESALDDIVEDIGDLTSAVGTLQSEKADLDSPTFVGVPAAPTPDTVDESTKLATTAYVAAKIAASTPGGDSITIGDWTIEEDEDGNLLFITGASVKAKLNTDGDFLTAGTLGFNQDDLDPEEP